MEKTNKHKHRDTIPVRRYFPLICMLVLGVVVSFVLFWLVSRWEQTHQRQEFESRAKTYTNALETSLTNYAGALLFLGDFINHSSFVTRQEFSGFVKSLLPRYPGIQAFGWNPLVKDNERSSYESSAQKEGFDGFGFTERSENKKQVRAARREEYVVVYYMHPLEGNREAFGFDIASEKTRLKAITEAFNTGKLSATDRLTLVQETGNQFCILLLLPIYHQGVPLKTQEERHKNRKGVVVEVLRLGQVVEFALQGLLDDGISLTLYDMSADKGKRLLYHRPSRMSKTTDQPLPVDEIQGGLSWSKTLNFAERKWKILLSPSDFFYQSRKMLESWVVLFGSLLLTTLSGLYMFKKIFYTMEIEQRVQKQAEINQMLQNEIKVRITTEAELDKSILNLQQAQDEVKRLRGILPICASCKKIRDDKGSWNQIESYIKDHSEAEFSHSICPECAEKLYPDIYDDKDETT